MNGRAHRHQLRAVWRTIRSRIASVPSAPSAPPPAVQWAFAAAAKRACLRQAMVALAGDAAAAGRERAATDAVRGLRLRRATHQWVARLATEVGSTHICRVQTRWAVQRWAASSALDGALARQEAALLRGAAELQATKQAALVGD